MVLELQPPQPEPVRRALEALLVEAQPQPPDPWWQAGLEAALRDGMDQGETTARPLKTLGADRA